MVGRDPVVGIFCGCRLGAAVGAVEDGGMTDRIAAFTVVLDEPIREDDVETIMNALKQIRCVLTVKRVIADSSYYAGTVQMDIKWRKRLANFVSDMNEPRP